MGEDQGSIFTPEFNRSIQVEARAERLSTEAGALLLRELMERTGLMALLRSHLKDPRDGSRVVHPFDELLRTTLLLLTQGWSDQFDVNGVRNDPILRLAVSGRRGERPLRESEGQEPEGLCSQPTLSRHLAALGTAENLAGLATVLREASGQRMGLRANARVDELTADLDSVPIQVHGQQPGSHWNGHYGERCYHPLIVRSEWGDYLGAKLRPGNAHTAEGGLEFVLPILRWLATFAERVWVRMDAGFPEPELLSRLEEERFCYVARLKTNAVLARLAEPHLQRLSDEPSLGERVWTQELSYQAKSWDRSRRVVLIGVERSDAQANLFRDHFFLLTNVAAEEMAPEVLLQHYRQRGSSEKDFGEWQQALNVPLSSTPRPKSHYQGRPIEEAYEEPDSFGANEARLLLSLVAANLMHAGAALLDREITARTSRERFRQLLLKCAARVLLSGRRITVVIEQARAELWVRFVCELNRVYPARGSPAAGTLPS